MSSSGVIQIYVYEDGNLCGRKKVNFPLTDEGIEKAIVAQRRFLIEEMERLAVKPLVVPYPPEKDISEGYLIVPKWIIDKIAAQNRTIRDEVSRSAINSVLAAMWKSGLLEYADTEGDSHEFSAGKEERR